MPGDTIIIVHGDRSGGALGYRLQTFCEAAFEICLLAEPRMTCVVAPVGSGIIEIVAGPGKTLALGLRAGDHWGNAAAFWGDLHGQSCKAGDRDVFFLQEGLTIRRSSHGLLEDRENLAKDASTVTKLFAAHLDEDCVRCAHVGGRMGDILLAHDPRLHPAVEVHSDWGTFEWIKTDAFALGQHVGLVCDSNGHKGAPGACHPWASEFDPIMTGNFGGCDLTLDGAMAGRLDIVTDLVCGSFDPDGIGLQEQVLEAVGLERRPGVMRLPGSLTALDMRVAAPNFLLLDRVTTDDGFNLWSSPIHHIPEPEA